jgi:hypothetical protein
MYSPLFNLYTASQTACFAIVCCRAATEGQQEVAAALLAGGADVHARDNDMWTPLQVSSSRSASSWQHPYECLQLFLVLFLVLPVTLMLCSGVYVVLPELPSLSSSTVACPLGNCGDHASCMLFWTLMLCVFLCPAVGARACWRGSAAAGCRC